MILEDKYIVYNRKDIDKLPIHLQNALDEISDAIADIRKERGKAERSSYIVINSNWTSAYNIAFNGLQDYIRKQKTDKLVRDVIAVLEKNDIHAYHKRPDLVKLLQEIGNGK